MAKARPTWQFCAKCRLAVVGPGSLVRCTAGKFKDVPLDEVESHTEKCKAFADA